MKPHLKTAIECHLPYGITQCYLSQWNPTQVNTSRLNSNQGAGTRFTYSGGMEG